LGGCDRFWDCYQNRIFPFSWTGGKHERRLPTGCRRTS
jgi:hypothetical protein